MKNPYKIPPPKEDVEQQQLFEWALWQSGACPELDYLYHVPNGGLRNKAVAGKLKAQGVKSGVPDLCLPVARNGFHGLYVEMKRKGETTSERQKEWLAFLKEGGYRTAVCEGCEAAIIVICDYMGIRPPVNIFRKGI
ncbi:MAG: VRR-NUC domain-containing protein [Oscillospiraceae bacterium]